MRFCIISLFLSILFNSFFAAAQGCSDAGFCSMGAMKPDQHFKKNLDIKLRSLEINQYVARTKFEDVIMATSAEVNVGIGKKNTFQLKVPYMVILSVLGNFHNVGDVSFSFSRNLLATEKYQINATIGGKIPTGNSDMRTSEGLPIPMYHQATLGTFDFIAGISFISKGWLIATGYQLPLNENDNQFLWQAWENHPLFDKAFHFPQSKDLRRKSDVMLRVERNFRFAKFNFHIGLLNIHRFNRDEITNEQGIRIRVKNSNGSALSLLVGATYHLNAKSSLKFIFGDRWLERDRNPDGLSREQVWSLAYGLNF